jgi:hypothetical protein
MTPYYQNPAFAMSPVEAAALSEMTGYTYEPIVQPPLKPLEPTWWEDQPTRLNWYQDPRDNDRNYHD